MFRYRNNPITFDNDLILIGKREESKDDYGNPIYSEPKRKQVFCNERSIGYQEFYRAGTEGLRPEYALTIHDFEYENEKQVEYKGQVYEVLRTYKPDAGLLELTVGEKIGSI